MVEGLWTVFWAAMLPLAELRGAIPLGIGLYHLHPAAVFVVAILGNVVPVVAILVLLNPMTRWLRRANAKLDRFFTWLFAHTYRRHSAKFDRWGSLALMLFVAIPLPATGGWTGAFLAYLFGIKFKYALLNIVGGIIIAGVIVTLITLGGVWVFSLPAS
ncbi:hypothetical protein A2V68_00285 [candidate division Kazan bacterium RBG_13_50_9]|uniref:Ligand-binding protein SH3 n=1 Tax=candidate division Kazan bacterium RBG_13_50_9 TaxID=1798535 RepID=A0A1F4NSB5_UNCK3|nr:MAG: hypothetical protein A2V68_00285 [candidate division Kazan bacterium RBG_13_50_9]